MKMEIKNFWKRLDEGQKINLINTIIVLIGSIGSITLSYLMILSVSLNFYLIVLCYLGIITALIGLTSNFLALAFNNFKMPVFVPDFSNKLIKKLNKDDRDLTHKLFNQKEDMKLFYLCDIINLKKEIKSVGDIMLHISHILLTIFILMIFIFSLIGWRFYGN